MRAIWIALSSVAITLSALAQRGPVLTAGAPSPADLGDTSRPIRLVGSVMMDDGSDLPRGVSIKSICNGVELAVGSTQ